MVVEYWIGKPLEALAVSCKSGSPTAQPVEAGSVAEIVCETPSIAAVTASEAVLFPIALRATNVNE